MEHIDVRGLPDPIAQTVKSMVEALRRQLNRPPTRAGGPAAVGPFQLDHHPGQVIGPLTRDEMYDDAA